MGSWAQERHHQQEARTEETSSSTSSAHSPHNITLWKPQQSNWISASPSVLLPWLHSDFIIICYHTSYIPPNARILLIHCMPVVKHEKTRKELAQPTDLESTDFEVDKVLTNIVVLTNKHGLGQGGLHCYVITSQFHFCISILKMLRCVITVVLPTVAANKPQLRCQKALV